MGLRAATPRLPLAFVFLLFVYFVCFVVPRLEEITLRILLTNDDGVYAPGLRALLPELCKLGEVRVVAPATEQSAVGHSVTILTPLLAQEIYDEHRQ